MKRYSKHIKINSFTKQKKNETFLVAIPKGIFMMYQVVIYYKTLVYLTFKTKYVRIVLLTFVVEIRMN